MSKEEKNLKKIKRRLPVNDLMGSFSDKGSFNTYLKE